MSELPPTWQKRFAVEPVNAEECRAAGRFSFEERLMERLVALDGLFGGTAGLTDECLAAFDHAAWDAWEASKG